MIVLSSHHYGGRESLPERGWSGRTEATKSIFGARRTPLVGNVEAKP